MALPPLSFPFMKSRCALIALFLFAGFSAAQAFAARQMETLGRALIALKSEEKKLFVSWRVLGTDPDALAFNLYRVTGDAAPTKLNERPITGGTNFVDTRFDPGKANAYFVRAVLEAREHGAHE